MAESETRYKSPWAQTMTVVSVCETTCFSVTKTRTIILFMSTTLNRLGFEGTATGHFHFINNETGYLLVNNTPAKLQLSVRTKSRTNAVDMTCQEGFKMAH